MVTLKLISSLKGHKGVIWSIVWGMSGNFLISIGVDSILTIWGPNENSLREKFYKKSYRETSYFKSWCKIYQVKTSKTLRTFRGLARKKNSSFFSISDFKNNSYLLQLTFLKCSRICLVEIKHLLFEHSSEIKGCSFSPNEIFLASCGRDRSIWVWKNEYKKKIFCDNIFKEGKGDMKCLKWSPRNLELIYSSYEGTLGFIFYENKNKLITESKVSHSTISNVFFDSTGKKIIFGNDMGELFYFTYNPPSLPCFVERRLENIEMSIIFFSNLGPIPCMSKSKKNCLFLSGNSDGTVILTKIRKIAKKKNPICDEMFEINKNYFFGVFTRIPNCHYGKINTIIWHPIFEDIFVTCGDDSSINICRITRIRLKNMLYTQL